MSWTIINFPFTSFQTIARYWLFKFFQSIILASLNNINFLPKQKLKKKKKKLTNEESEPVVILLPEPSNISTSIGGSNGKFAATFVWWVVFVVGTIRRDIPDNEI